MKRYSVRYGKAWSGEDFDLGEEGGKRAYLGREKGESL